VAEDEALVRMFATDLLEDAGFQVIEATNAAEALERLHGRTDVSVVFTDIEMPPGMNGVCLAGEVTQRWPGVPVLISSGKLRPASSDLPPGARFLPKPYSPAVLVQAIRDMVRPKRSIS
jgi:CheY-like chemotaxis protein